MLVLSRHISESIVLRIDGELIATITLVALGQGKARIGIDAPMVVEVLRSELLPFANSLPDPQPADAEKAQS